VEIDEAMLELICWIMLALELMRDCPEYNSRDDNNVREIVALVDFMQGEAKKLIRSAAQL
jgi:hypothetical protein